MGNMGIYNETARFWAGIAWLVVGGFLLLSGFSTWLSWNICFFNWMKIATQYLPFIWCIGWTTIGVGACLINTRNHSYRSWITQHIFYCGFVCVAVSLAAFTTAVYWSGESWQKPDSKFYSISALVGLVGGFIADLFRPLVHGIAEKLEIK